MRPFVISSAFILSLLLPVATHAQEKGPVKSPYPAWQHSGEFAVLTTSEGANLPASASVEHFLVLVRVRSESFDFSQA